MENRLAIAIKFHGSAGPYLDMSVTALALDVYGAHYDLSVKQSNVAYGGDDGAVFMLTDVAEKSGPVSPEVLAGLFYAAMKVNYAISVTADRAGKGPARMLPVAYVEVLHDGASLGRVEAEGPDGFVTALPFGTDKTFLDLWTPMTLHDEACYVMNVNDDIRVCLVPHYRDGIIWYVEGQLLAGRNSRRTVWRNNYYATQSDRDPDDQKLERAGAKAITEAMRYADVEIARFTQAKAALMAIVGPDRGN